MVRTTTILRTSALLTLADAATLIASATVAIVIGRWLGPAPLGAYSLAVTIGMLVQTVADAGYSIWLPRAISQSPMQIHNLIISAVATKTTLWMASVPFAISVALLHSRDTLILTGIIMLDTLVKLVVFSILAVLRGIGYYGRPHMIWSGYTILTSAIMVAILAVSGNLSFAATFMAFGSVLGAWHLTVVLKRRTGSKLTIRFNRKSLFRTVVEQLRAQSQLWIVNVSSSLIHRLPLVVLGIRGNNFELGYFSAAYRLYSALRIVPGSLFNTVLPKLTIPAHRKRTVTTILAGGFISALITGSVLWIGSPVLVYVTFGFEHAILPLQLLSIAYMGLFAKTILEAVLIAQMEDRLISSATMICAGLTLITSMFIPSHAVSFSWLTIGAEWFLCIIFAVWHIQRKFSG